MEMLFLIMQNVSDKFSNIQHKLDFAFKKLGKLHECWWVVVGAIKQCSTLTSVTFVPTPYFQHFSEVRCFELKMFAFQIKTHSTARICPLVTSRCSSPSHLHSHCCWASRRTVIFSLWSRVTSQMCNLSNAEPAVALTAASLHQALWN